MASFIHLVLSLLVIFSLVAPSISSPTEKLTPETLKRICSFNVHPRLCFRTLRHDPRTKTLHLNHLTLAYVERTRGKAQSTIFLLGKLAEATTDLNLKSSYIACSNHYAIALADLNQAKQRLSSGSYTGVAGLATMSVAGPSECDDEFDNGDKKYKPKELVDSNMEFATLGGIVFAMAAELVIP